MSNTVDYGPQHRHDPPFTARMRFHQSWYRAHVLGVPYGAGPKSTSKTVYGNMLTLPDGEKGLNFLRPHIFAVAQRRIAMGGGHVDRFRLLCNLLHSQPMCFNLFAPLVDDRGLATALLQTMLPDPVGQVEKVRLEYAPEPVRDYLNDHTAFDAYIEYTRPGGALAFLGIQVRLAELPPPGEFRLPAYEHWSRRPNSPWPSTAWDHLNQGQTSALWRLHLLAVAMLSRPGSPYSTGRVLLLYHPGDEDTPRQVEAYRALLKPGDQGFAALPLDRLLSDWEAAADRPVDMAWLASFRQRYLDLSGSDEEYNRLTS